MVVSVVTPLDCPVEWERKPHLTGKNADRQQQETGDEDYLVQCEQDH